MGGGNGRVAKEILLPKFKHVDLADFSLKMLEGAKKNVPNVRNFYNYGIQNVDYKRRYDCVWVQWVMCYLNDKEFLDFLVNTRKNGLTRG